MKNSKRFLAMMTAGFLAITPMAATGLTAFASTLTVTDTETADHTYNAYQIITGTKSGDSLVGTLAWGTGVNSATLITQLKANAPELGITLGETPTIDEVAAQLSSITAADKKELLAKIFNESGVLTSTSTPLTRSGDNYSATVDDGWYLVVDDSALTGDDKVYAKSANLLQVVGNTTVTTKHSLPTLEKNIIDSVDADSDGELDRVDANTASIGDTINYEIKTKVPNITGYNKYFFIVEDTLSAGLDYDVDSIAVKIGNTTLDKDTNGHTDSEKGKYYVETEGKTQIKVVFEDFLNYIKDNNIAKDTDIVITYNARLNADASIDPTVGNPNTAKLKYSNDPNVNYTGTPGTTPDEPQPPTGGNSGEVVGETPPDTVKTYTTAIKIKKVDTSGKVLEGAGFTLTGVSSGQALVITNSFTVDSSGSYWKLKDGTYTTTNPNDTGVDSTLYESETTKYAKATTTTLKGTGQTDTNISALVGNDGYIVFKGLGAGTYTLTETPPEGYNPIPALTITIGNSPAPSTSNPNWTVASGESSYVTLSDNTYNVTITNSKGATLPTTGGIGTKLFYIIGGLLVAGSVVLLVTKKRMKTNED